MRKGLTQLMLAERSGLSLSGLAEIEHGRLAKKDTLERVFAALGCDNIRIELALTGGRRPKTKIAKLKPVTLHGVTYPSIAQAARELDTTRYKITLMTKKQRAGP
jgi:transcriptional regulator with XRE-family HTH domain